MDRPSRPEIEDFLYYEASLIDSWRLREWLECFDPEAQYIVPATDCPPEKALTTDPLETVCLLADDVPLMKARVDRLENFRAHAEHPRSVIRHMITNPVVRWHDDERCDVHTSLAVFWRHHDAERLYVGRCLHRLRPTGKKPVADSFRILERRVALDNGAVGALSFII